MKSINNKVAIIGQGYVGLPLSMKLVKNGFIVFGVDNDPAKIKDLQRGTSVTVDVTNEEISIALKSNMYIPSTTFECVKDASTVIICVPTPLDNLGQPDIDPLSKASINLAPFLTDGTLVVSESTSFPGTLREVIVPLIEKHKDKNLQNLYFAVAPERVNPGDVTWNQTNTPRVIGALGEPALHRAVELYSKICSDIKIVSAPEIAEASKLFENTFRLVNISLVNEFAKLCSVRNLDITEIIDAASSKPFGFMRFNQGIGAGGHCIPVDPVYLTWWASKSNFKLSIVDVALKINELIPEFVVEKAISLLTTPINTTRILVLGVSYKTGVSDLRESQSIKIIEKLRSNGANVFWHDPIISNWSEEKSSDLNMEYDLVIYALAQPGVILDNLLRRRIPILDCTNSLSQSEYTYSLY